MKEESLLQVTVDLDTEEGYLDLLLQHQLEEGLSETEKRVLSDAIIMARNKISSLRTKQIKLHAELSAVVASYGLPTYDLP